MFMKTKIGLAATLVALTTTVAMAQEFDPDLANRYPAYADPGTYGYVGDGEVPTQLRPTPHATLQSAPVGLNRRNTSVNRGQLDAQ